MDVKAVVAMESKPSQIGDQQITSSSKSVGAVPRSFAISGVVILTDLLFMAKRLLLVSRGSATKSSLSYLIELNRSRKLFVKSEGSPHSEKAGSEVGKVCEVVGEVGEVVGEVGEVVGEVGEVGSEVRVILMLEFCQEKIDRETRFFFALETRKLQNPKCSGFGKQ